MTFNRDDASTWPCFRPLIIAHDVGRSQDRSTAVGGGNSPFEPRLLGIRELEELPQGLYGSACASALARIDRLYNSNPLIVELQNDQVRMVDGPTARKTPRSTNRPSPIRSKA
jgi:hypothetical protein